MNHFLEKQKKLISEFSQLHDWESKYKLIIEKGKKLPPLQESKKTEDNLIKGCQSQVWLVASLDEKQGTVRLYGDSDALIVKGLAAILIEVFDNELPLTILNSDLTFLDSLGLQAHLTPSRANGLNSMVKQIKRYAIAFDYLLNKKN